MTLCKSQVRKPVHIGIAGPVDLAPLCRRIPHADLPSTYSFPLVGQLAESLILRGYQVSLFAESTQIATGQRIVGDGVCVHICPLRPRRAVYDFFAKERSSLSEAMKESGCDLIHAHWTYEFAAAALDSGLPCLITAHDSPLGILRYFVLTRYFSHWGAKAILGAVVIRRSHRLTTVSPYCRDDIRRFLRPRAPISVVPNGIHPAILELGRKRLDGPHPDGPPAIFAIMEGFQDRKNPKALLSAFGILRASMRDAALHLYGTGFEENGPAASWARHHGLAAGVAFHGKQPHGDVMQLLATQAHLLIHPALEESFGMAPLEAMACGVPVIGHAHAGGVPYVLDGGRAGLLVDMRRPVLIAGAARQLLMDKRRCSDFSELGWKRASGTFSLQAMTDAYTAEYELLLGSKNRP